MKEYSIWGHSEFGVKHLFIDANNKADARKKFLLTYPKYKIKSINENK